MELGLSNGRNNDICVNSVIVLIRMYYGIEPRLLLQMLIAVSWEAGAFFIFKSSINIFIQFILKYSVLLNLVIWDVIIYAFWIVKPRKPTIAERNYLYPEEKAFRADRQTSGIKKPPYLWNPFVQPQSLGYQFSSLLNAETM